MIPAAIFPRALQGEQVSGIGDHTDQAIAAFGVTADLTAWFGTEVEARLALADLASGRQQCFCKTLDLLLGLTQQMQGKALGRARANAW